MSSYFLKIVTLQVCYRRVHDLIYFIVLKVQVQHIFTKRDGETYNEITDVVGFLINL